MKKIDTILYLVTSRDTHTEESFYETVKQALENGVSIVQLREKDITTKEYIELGKKILKLCHEYDVPLLIDDRLDVALAIDADGIHVGKDDIDVCLARKFLGKNKIVGATAKTVEDAIQAEREGADYIGTGAIYPTTTKVKTKITSVKTLIDIVKSVSIPVNAIGGLNIDNIDILKDTSIAGVCVVSAIMYANNPGQYTKELLKKIKKILNK